MDKAPGLPCIPCSNPLVRLLMRMPHDTMGTGAPHACSSFYLKCGPLLCASACMASCTIASIHASGLDHHMHERSPHPNLKLNPDPLPQAGERCVVCGRTLGLCIFCATASSTASVAAIRDPHANGRHAPTPNARPYVTMRSHPAPARSDPTQPNPTQSYPTGGCLMTSWLLFFDVADAAVVVLVVGC